MAMSNELSNKKRNNKGKAPKRSFLKSIFPAKGDGFLESLRKILFLISIAAIIFSLKMLYEFYNGNPDDNKLISDLQDIYSQTSTESTASSSSDSQQSELSKFERLYELNSDIIGWIEIGDIISYPVVQTVDNDFYLKRNFEKKDSKAGTIFADYRGPITQDLTPDNIVLYGHNMKAGTFFHSLLNYKKIDFMKENPTITFDTLYNENEWEIFACFLTSVNPNQDGGVVFDYHNRIHFNDETSFNNFYDEVMKRSYYNTGVDVKYGDDILTLSTCDDSVFVDSRFVVVARRVRDGEDASVDTSKITENKNKYMPLIWYEVMGIKAPR